MQVGELCKVRRDAVELPGAKYEFAIVKRSNKHTARIVLLDQQLSEQGEFLVTFESLWKLKAATRRATERRRARQSRRHEEDAHDPPGLSRVREMRDGLECIAHMPLCGSPGTTLTFVEGGVTDCTTGAIVNAANEGCLGGGGIDGAIGLLGGQALFEARLALPILSGPATWEPDVRCPTGDAKITIAGELACDHVIHAVGPNFHNCFDDPTSGYAALESAYKAALARATERGVRTVAFCILSGGIFRGDEPLSKIISFGVDMIAKHATSAVERIYFCAFTPAEQRALELKLEALELFGFV